jgi:hypothetical protein
LLLLAIITAGAAELEHFYLVDGRSLVGEYDSSTGILSVVTPSGKISISVTPANIVARKPVKMDDAILTAPKPTAQDPVIVKPVHRTRGEILSDYDECQNAIDKAEKRSIELKNTEKNGGQSEAQHWAQDIIGRGGDDLLFVTTYVSQRSTIPFEDLGKVVLFANAVSPGNEISILIGVSDAVTISGEIGFIVVRDIEGTPGIAVETPVKVTAMLLTFNRGKATSVDEAVASAKRISDSMLTHLAEVSDTHRAAQSEYDRRTSLQDEWLAAGYERWSAFGTLPTRAERKFIKEPGFSLTVR